MSAATRMAVVLVLGSLAGTAVVGCSGDDPGPSPSPTTTQTATPGATAEPSVEPPDPTTSEPTPSVEPTAAAGLLLEEETSRLNAPEGEWERIPDVVTYASAVGRVSTTELISLSDRENFATAASLDEQVKFHRRSLPDGAIVERLPDVDLDGEPAYYIQWYEKGDTLVQHDIGVDHQGRVVSIQMDLDRTDAGASDALVAAVLASFAWR